MTQGVVSRINVTQTHLIISLETSPHYICLHSDALLRSCRATSRNCYTRQVVGMSQGVRAICPRNRAHLHHTRVCKGPLQPNSKPLGYCRPRAYLVIALCNRTAFITISPPHPVCIKPFSCSCTLTRHGAVHIPPQRDPHSGPCKPVHESVLPLKVTTGKMTDAP